MSKETLIEKLRGYKSTPRHCEELCYEAANEIESLRQQLADSQKQVALLRGMIAIAALHVQLYDDLTEALAATEPKP